MHLPRRIAGFALRLALLYGLLVTPWPGLKDGYAAVFRAGGNALFSRCGAEGSVRFVPADPEQQREWDTELHLFRRGHPIVWRIGYSSRYASYLPTVTVTALILAAPIPWSRRWRALPLGLLLVHVFIAFRVAVSVLHGFRGVDLFVFSPLWNRAVDLGYEILSISTVTSCLVPALIWIVVSLRSDDFGPGAEPWWRGRRGSGHD